MKFTMMNLKEREFIMLFVIVTTAIVLGILIILIINGKEMFQSMLLVIILLFLFVDIAALLELNRLIQKRYGFAPTIFGFWANSVNGYVHIIIAIVINIFSFYMLFSWYKSWKVKLNQFSIKETMENLPHGLLFFEKDGLLYLSNYIIQKLYTTLTGKKIQNGLEFWEDLIQLQNEQTCVIRGGEPAYLLPNGEVWQFNKTVFDLAFCSGYLIEAVNITELYRLSEEMRKINQNLSIQQETLANQLKSRREQRIQQVIADAKIHLHNGFGNILISSKQVLKNSADNITKEVILEYSSSLNEMVAAYSRGDNQLALDKIELLAQKLECEFQISTKLPKEKKQCQIVLLAVNEMLKNAVYHANAKKMVITLDIKEKNYVLCIRNNMMDESLEVYEGGGLTGLREQVESIGGTMNLYRYEEIELQIVLPKD